MINKPHEVSNQLLYEQIENLFKDIPISQHSDSGLLRTLWVAKIKLCDLQPSRFKILGDVLK